MTPHFKQGMYLRAKNDMLDDEDDVIFRGGRLYQITAVHGNEIGVLSDYPHVWITTEELEQYFDIED